MSKELLYVSTDIEADGRIPGFNSMLSFGSAAFLPSGDMIGTFTANLTCLPNATADKETMEWWKTQKEAWENYRKDLQEPFDAMNKYVAWLKAFERKCIFVGYPATYDFLFVYWYLIKFTGESPFGFAALDIKSYIAGMTGWDFNDCTKRNFPKHWFGKGRHNHIALDDAIEQGELFINVLKESLDIKPGI